MCEMIAMQTNFRTEVTVAEIKKSYIDNIVKSAEKCDKIDAIVLFGSALESRCKDDSDIDIAIISKYTVNSLCKYKSFQNFTDNLYANGVEQEYDILYFKSLEESEKKKDTIDICKELFQKGKVIYMGGCS